MVTVEQAVAAPFATRQLADLGARVIKVERPGGDFARRYDTAVHGESSYFVWLNRAKESLTLDLKAERDREILDTLLGRADIFVQNLAPGAAARLHLDPTTLQARHPQLIPCEITGYGTTGPWSARKAYDLLVQCQTGLVSLTGTPESTARPGISIADIAGGMYAYTAILTALYTRATTGTARAVTVSLFDALAEWMSQPAYYTRYTGHQPPKTGTHHPTIAPYGAYKAKDGKEILFAIQNEREWQSFCTDFLARPDIQDDRRFTTNEARVTHRQDLDEIIKAKLATMDSKAVTTALDKANIANTGVNTVHDFLDHPVLSDRNRWQDVLLPGGTMQALLPPVTMDGVEPRMAAVPSPGEHTASILTELGYPPA
ncbi:formyl-CoA transferase [Actinocrispum wychmicini]|uniref:Formyl-CoA transferase n=1 Tax=Actinocrispum wychmicini TaxID=1213861 RepID=A0A4R2JYA7_9PSEU|nr:formyl-CoA transferase [Actinocrispum wychmicini]